MGGLQHPPNPPAAGELADASSCRLPCKQKNSLREFLFARLTQIFLISTTGSNPSVSIAISEVQNHCHKNVRKGTLSPRLVIFTVAYKIQKAKKLAFELLEAGV